MKDKLRLDELMETEAELEARVDLSAYDKKAKENLLDDIMLEFGKEPFSSKKADERPAAHIGSFVPVKPSPSTPAVPVPAPPPPAGQTSDSPLGLERDGGRPLTPAFKPKPPASFVTDAAPLSEPKDAKLDTYDRIYRLNREKSEDERRRDNLYSTWSREFNRTSDNVRRTLETDTIIFGASTEERDIWGRVLDRSEPQRVLRDETFEIYGGAPRGSLKAEMGGEDEHRQDPADVRSFLVWQKRGLAVKTILAFLVCAAAVVLTLSIKIPLPLPKALTDPGDFLYALSHLSLSLAAFLLYLRYAGHALWALVRLRFYNDTLPLLALLASIAYNFSIASGLFEAGPATPFFTMIPVAVIAFSLLGKLVFVRNVLQNFELAVSPGAKHAGTLIKTSHMPVRFFGGDRKACSIRRVDSITGFFEKSFSDDPSEKATQITAPLALLLCAAVAAAAALHGRTAELFPLITLGLALSAPLFSELAFSLPFYVLSKYSRKNGGAILGYRAVRHYEDVDMVVADDKELFPPDKAVVQSMRVTSRSAIDEVLIAAASLICAMDSPLKEAFMSIVDNKPELLKPVDSYACIDNQGATGIIDSRRYYLGSVEFIRSSGVDISQKMLEAASSKNTPALLLATDSSAVAVFFTDYGADSATAGILRRFCTPDTSLVVITDDSGVSEDLIKERCGLVKTDVLLPRAEEKRMYRESVLPLESASAGILSVNGIAGVVAALSITRKVRDVVNTCLLLRAAGVFISLLFLLYFTVTGSVINPWQALAMQLLWAFPSVVSIFVRRLK